MTENNPRKNITDLAIFMDLLGHDIQNSNQAVLSYLELIISSPTADDKTKRYAARAASQMRTSSILLDNMKSLMKLRDVNRDELPEVDLKKVVEQAATKLHGLFLDRKILIDHSGIMEDMTVSAGAYAGELFDSLLMNIVQLSKSDEMSIALRSKKEVRDGVQCWRICIEAPDMAMPSNLETSTPEISSDEDLSKIVRISGIFFAGTLAKALEGSLDMTTKDSEPGCSFILTMKMGGGIHD